VLKESKLAAHGLEVGAPLGVVAGAKFQCHRDVGLDVDSGKGDDGVSHVGGARGGCTVRDGGGHQPGRRRRRGWRDL